MEVYVCFSSCCKKQYKLTFTFLWEKCSSYSGEGAGKSSLEMVQKIPQKEENGLELSDREGRFLSMDEILTGKL